MASPVASLVRKAALISITSGLIGGYVWSVDLYDRIDGDDLRWGFWPNPFMRFEPFSEAYLDISMWVLLGCSATIGLGGLLLLVPSKWGTRLVAWQAPVAIAANSIVIIFIALMAFDVPPKYWTSEALFLRLGSVLVNFGLWIFLRSNTVAEYIHQPRQNAPIRGGS
jgi:hypothetical protein